MRMRLADLRQSMASCLKIVDGFLLTLGSAYICLFKDA
ncbi:hypothetical protein BN2497_11801 [Janthinobacterium sp. CG23_2]|nr:hypothetical protein BN2497_11801 [Janthinobacterium sp. CG23_2]CUU32298.1 hypothetical protein BN3177_11801 [Janthinobacterium sp. CG23_2]